MHAGVLGWSEAVALVAAFVLAAVFAFAGLSKLRGRRHFRDVLGALELFPPPLPSVLARLVPAVELVLAAVLLARVVPVFAGLAAACSLLAFSVVLAVYRARGGTHLRCGCFGDSDRPHSTMSALIRNAVLLAVALVSTSAPQVLAAGDAVATAITVAGLLGAWHLGKAAVELSRLSAHEREEQASWS